MLRNGYKNMASTWLRTVLPKFRLMESGEVSGLVGGLVVRGDGPVKKQAQCADFFLVLDSVGCAAGCVAGCYRLQKRDTEFSDGFSAMFSFNSSAV